MIDQPTLYKAYSAAYGRERNHHVIAQIIDVAFVAAALALNAAGVDFPQLSAIALVWLAVREAPWFLRPDQYRRLAARIQEQFDCTLGIPPNDVLTGEPVPDHEVLALADGCSAELPSDYFVDTDGLRPEVAAVVVQHQTATWAELGHRRYSRLNYVVAFLTIVGLVAWAYISDRDTQTVVTRLLAPSAPFIVGRLQLGRRHQQQAEDRASIRRRAERALDAVSTDSAQYPRPQFVRALQDRLYQARLGEGRIPQWLYALRGDKDRRTIDVSCHQRAQRLKARAAGTEAGLG